MTKFKIFLLSFILIRLFMPAHAAFADTGPKPTMEFAFKQDLAREPVTITSGILYECEQADCSDATPLQQLGPQGLRCDAQSCNALAYGFRPYHRLEIEFSDGVTRESNIFETAGFDSKYIVTIRPDDLLVEAQFNLTAAPPAMLILIACICALMSIGLITGLIIFFIRRSARK